MINREAWSEDEKNIYSTFTLTQKKVYDDLEGQIYFLPSDYYSDLTAIEGMNDVK